MASFSYLDDDEISIYHVIKSIKNPQERKKQSFQIHFMKIPKPAKVVGGKEKEKAQSSWPQRTIKRSSSGEKALCLPTCTLCSNQKFPLLSLLPFFFFFSKKKINKSMNQKKKKKTNRVGNHVQHSFILPYRLGEGSIRALLITSMKKNQKDCSFLLQRRDWLCSGWDSRSTFYKNPKNWSFGGGGGEEWRSLLNTFFFFFSLSNASTIPQGLVSTPRIGYYG